LEFEHVFPFDILQLTFELRFKSDLPKMKAALIADRRDVQTLHVWLSRPFDPELAAWMEDFVGELTDIN